MKKFTKASDLILSESSKYSGFETSWQRKYVWKILWHIVEHTNRWSYRNRAI